MSSVFNSIYCHYSSIEKIVKEKNKQEELVIYFKFPSKNIIRPYCFVSTKPVCRNRIMRNIFSCEERKNVKPGLLELHNTKETMIGYFLML